MRSTSGDATRPQPYRGTLHRVTPRFEPTAETHHEIPESVETSSRSLVKVQY